MRYLLTMICPLQPGFGRRRGLDVNLLQKEFPKTPWEQRPRVEQNVCIDCHTSDLMKEDYREHSG